MTSLNSISRIKTAYLGHIKLIVGAPTFKPLMNFFSIDYFTQPFISRGSTIAHYQRQGEHEWLLREYQSLEDELHLSALQPQVAVATFYENVKFG